METAFDSPALTGQAPDYPAEWRNRVPKRVKMTTRVTGEIPVVRDRQLVAAKGEVYDCYVNSHGAVSAITPNGLLGLVPGEFEVTAWHDHLVMRNRADSNYELYCYICRVALILDLPISMDDFVTLTEKFSHQHRHGDIEEDAHAHPELHHQD